MRYFCWGIVFALVAANPVFADVLSDDFDDGTLAPRWFSDGYGDYSVVENGGKLNINVPASLEDAGGYASSHFVLLGDFDVSVDFEAFGPGAVAYSRQAHLVLWGSNPTEMSGNVKIMDRVGPGREYAMNFTTFYGFREGVDTPDTTTSGSLRIVRYGATFLGYYGDGDAWALIGALDAWTDATTVLLGAGHAEPDFPAVSVSFDNFHAEADQIVPEPSTFILLIMGTLAGAIGWWRRGRAA